METTIQIEQKNGVAWVWMNRPDHHNAFDATLVAELDAAFLALNRDDDVRAVVLAGRGKSFSAGADLNWMREQGKASIEQNRDDARKLGEMLYRLHQMDKPVVARVQGAAIGGGFGLAAACTICIATENAVFATSEVRLGLAPAVISPYVLRAIGARQAQRYFLTAERISAQRAFEIGLVHEVVAVDGLDTAVDNVLRMLDQGGPAAQQASLALIRDFANASPTPSTLADTAERIARLRASPEGREGLDAFLEKRKAAWVTEA